MRLIASRLKNLFAMARVDKHTGQRYLQSDDILEEKRVPVTEKHFEYIRDRTSSEDEHLKRIKKLALENDMPPIWISPEQGSYMATLLRLMNAKTVVEVGTLAGYSAVWMARAVAESGKVHTLEIDEKYAKFSQDRVDEAGLSERVAIHVGDARVIMKSFAKGERVGVKPGQVDACFLDADKVAYSEYLQSCRILLRVGGLLMVDNAFGFGHLFDESSTNPDVIAIRKFNDELAADPQFEGVLVPIGDGLWVCRKVSD